MITVLFVPGFQEDLTSRDYEAVLAVMRSAGYEAVFVPINWKRTVLDDWVTELNSVYMQYDPRKTILAGFSYGSLTAFMAASQRTPAELWLCSFSPYFADDIPQMKKAWLRTIGKRRTERFARLTFEPLARKISCPTKIFVGEAEAKKYPLLGRRANIAHNMIAGSNLITVPKTGHDVADARYIAALRANI